MVAIFMTLFAAILLFFTPNLYAKNFGSTLCDSAEFNCYTVKRGETWKKLFPDETQRDLVMRINRMNIPLRSGLKIAIPNNLDGNLLEFAPFPQQIDPSQHKKVIISLNKLAFGAYNAEGNLEHWGPVSGGQGYCKDVGRRCTTVKGNFAIYQKGGAGCKSSRYPVGRGGAPMPFCMFFHGNYALHGSPIVPGYHASHGCVRIFTNDAQWLNQEFSAGEHVKVIIN